MKIYKLFIIIAVLFIVVVGSCTHYIIDATILEPKRIRQECMDAQIEKCKKNNIGAVSCQAEVCLKCNTRCP